VINIQSGAALQPRDDVMLHLSVRPQENAIIRNHMKNQVWGNEERHGANTIQAHQSFEIAITAEHSMYRIAVNGQHFCTFSHRLPLNLARYVSISGTCTVSYITVDHSGPMATPAHPPVHIHHPVHVHHPTFPVPPSTVHVHHHHPPAPPPMPIAPPPYPGNTFRLKCTFVDCSVFSTKRWSP
jgi:Galactoside-binding lectin